MNSRRDLLKRGGLLTLLVTCGAIGIEQARAADGSAFEQKTLEDALKALGATPADSDAITITAPDIAENGAVVPIAVASAIPRTEAIYLLVEKNPFPLAAVFNIPEGTEPQVGTRVKMGESTKVVAVVKAGGRLYSASRQTKVTLGGCGG